MMRLKIAILFGGCSSEYNVSLASAYAVITHLDENKYEPILIGISQTGEWFRFSGETIKIKENTWCNPLDCTRAIISPSRETGGILQIEGSNIREIRIDAAMPVLHGKNGEDGTVQGLLALAGIPLIGCGMLCSAICMDKHKAHQLVHAAGIRTPRSFVVQHNMDAPLVLRQANDVGYPVFVKPVNAGSSLGITKVFDQGALFEAINLALAHDDQVIIEESIAGFEVGCAILGNAQLTVGEVDEIELQDGFFTYEEKYMRETACIHVPARISKEKAEEVKDTAKRIYKTLGCAGFARVDMFLNPEGEIIFNEVNTIPGFTIDSRFPGMLDAAKITFAQIVNTVIELGVSA